MPKKCIKSHNGWRKVTFICSMIHILYNYMTSYVRKIATKNLRCHCIFWVYLHVIWRCLDKINRNFLWGSTTIKRKVHSVGWSKVIKPKCKGGLGIRKVFCLNKALLAKLNWRLQKNKDKVWAKTLAAKYVREGKSNFKYGSFV